MKKIMIVGLCLAGAVVLPAGCGIVTAPISAPAAVAQNANFDLTFVVMRPDRQAVSGAVLEQTLNHLFWEPIAGATTTNEHKNIQIADRVAVHERGEYLNLNFTHGEYFDAHFAMGAADTKSISSDFGRWTYAENFPVVMVPRSAVDAPLRLWQCTLSYIDFPNQRILELPRLWAPGTTTYQSPNYNPSNPYSTTLTNSTGGNTNTFSPPTVPALPPGFGRGAPVPTNARGPAVAITSDVNVTGAADMAPGSFYVTLTTQTPRVMNAKGEVDPLEVNLPGSLTMHVSGADGGFVRMEPRLGFAPIFTADAAPTSGYTPELTISRERLKEMRTAEIDRIVEAYEYFFIKSQGHYGKGYIAWSMRFDPKSKAPTPMAFRYGFWMEAVANESNLTWHRGVAK